MESWTEFVITRYNYWVVIVLMMIGLYTVFARGNLVKKVVGLNIFQTSVFVFYITIGKVAGGTAPIYIGDELYHGGGHDDEHGAEKGAGHGAQGQSDAAHGDALEHAAGDDPSIHAKIENTLAVNDLKAGANAVNADPGAGAESLHAAPDAGAKIVNEQLLDASKDAATGFDLAVDAAASAVDGAAYHSEVIYTNPLPHVLILTAIVVGVAGTAVGLALAIRIREAYGTIEEDELEVMDNVAEFGERAAKTAGASA